MTGSPLCGLPQGFPGHPGLPAHDPEAFCLCAQWGLGGVLPHGSLAGLAGGIFCEFLQVSLLLLDPQVTKENPEVTVG